MPVNYVQRSDCNYFHDYEEIFSYLDRRSGEVGDTQALEIKRQHYRSLILDDLFFIVLFVMEIEKANHPFVVDRCFDVQTGPRTDTIDIWARYHFKAIDLEEPVLTTIGWKSHGDLAVGDFVFHPSGAPVKVVAKTTVFTDAPCKKVTFTDGHSIICSGQHEWRVLRKIRRRLPDTEKRRREFVPAVVEADFLQSGDDVGIASALQYPAAALPIPPYTFGAWLGDGTSRVGQITNGYHDIELLDFIRAEGVSVSEVSSSNSGSGQYSLDAGIRGKRNTGMTCLLRKLGVKNNKHIPSIYMQASIPQRMEVLRGLMDTDGYADGRGTATFCNKSEKLSNDVYELAAGLGYRPRIRKHNQTLPDGRIYPFYQVSFQAYQDNAPFKLTRKVAACSPRVRFGSVRRLVKSVEDIPSVPVSCIQVDGSDGLYVVGRGLIPTHNSVIITQAETIQYHLKHPEHCTGIHAYARPLAKAFLRSIKTTCETSELLRFAFSDILWQNPQAQSPKWSLAINTPVLTVDGWKNHGDLQYGDKIFGSGGQVITVIGNSGPMENVDCRRVVFDDCELIASSEHLWPVHCLSYTNTEPHKWPSIPKVKIVTTDDLPIKNKSRRLPMTPVIKSPDHKDSAIIDPYILGLWLGDGTAGTNIISMHLDDEYEILNQIEMAGYEYYVHRKKPEDNFSMYGIRGLKEILTKVGCLKTKYIPNRYLFGTESERTALLQGLMDSDGTCKHTSSSAGMCTFCNTNPDLVDGVFHLAASLGLRPGVFSHMPKQRARKRIYHVYFVGIKSKAPFRSQRKLDKCKDKRHQLGRYVRLIEKIPSVTVNCIKVDAEDSLYLAGKSLVVTHNSEDEGLVFIRNSSSRKESTIEAWGLVEGQPTGRHFERNIFEDLETEDIRESPEMLEKVFSRFQMAGNLGTGSDSDINRIIGTYYSHFGPNVRIGDMVYPGTDKKIYHLRIFPGSDDGTVTGKPVLVGPETWEKLKASQHFHSQQLCNPTPKTEIKLPYNLLIPIDPKNMPKNRLKFLIIDPAGDDDVQSGKHNDSWAIGCISVKPDMDELGNSDIFIEDCECDTFGLGDDGGSAVDAVVNMHLRNGRIIGIGVEKVATDSSYKHIQNGLKAKHKKAIIKKTQRDNGNIVLLTPAGKTKARKIETSLSYPWYNGKIHISTRLAQRILDKIKEECDKFPYYHVDILDMISYIYQLLDALKFNFQLEDEEDEEDEFAEVLPVKVKSKVCGY